MLPFKLKWPKKLVKDTRTNICFMTLHGLNWSNQPLVLRILILRRNWKSKLFAIASCSTRSLIFSVVVVSLRLFPALDFGQRRNSICRDDATYFARLLYLIRKQLFRTQTAAPQQMSLVVFQYWLATSSLASTKVRTDQRANPLESAREIEREKERKIYDYARVTLTRSRPFLAIIFPLPAAEREKRFSFARLVSEPFPLR
jgi:hypothetical protein